MTKRFVAFLLSLMFVLTCTSAFAISGSECAKEEIEYRETGIATFLLDSSGNIIGALKPDEKIGTLNFQKCRRSSPANIKDGQAQRRRKFTRVVLDDDFKVVKGGSCIEVTITLTDLETVEEILGEEFTVADIIDATIYSPNITCANVKAAHMFMPQGSQRQLVGSIAFKNGTCLGLYAGYFKNGCQLDLGFRPLKVEAPEPKPCTPCQPCDPCPHNPCIPQCPERPQPCCPDVNVCTTTVVTTTVTTSTCVSTGGCK